MLVFFTIKNFSFLQFPEKPKCIMETQYLKKPCVSLINIYY